MNSDEEEEDEEEDPLWEDPFPSPLSELENEEEDPPNEEPLPSLSFLGSDPGKDREGSLLELATPRRILSSRDRLDCSLRECSCSALDLFGRVMNSRSKESISSRVRAKGP